MEKRISARGIIVEDNFFYAMFRRRINEGVTKEYYVIPGGGIEEHESLEEGLIREMKEELSVDVEILKYLGKDEGETSIAHFFSCKIVSGVLALGGEESIKNCESNYYEIKKISFDNLDEIDINPKNIIRKIKEEF